MKTALLFGATGLVGSHLLEDLLNDQTYDHVIAVTRRPLETKNAKLKNPIADFNSLEKIADQLTADDVYIALGTTKAKTPIVAEYYQVDHDYPVLAAKLARAHGAKSVSIVTAIGANAKSKLFYPRTKGEVERDIIALKYDRTNIFEPSMIMGERGEKRPMEKAFMELFAAIDPIFVGNLSRYRGIDGRLIANAMLKAPKSGAEKVMIYRWKQMRALAN